MSNFTDADTRAAMRAMITAAVNISHNQDQGVRDTTRLGDALPPGMITDHEAMVKLAGANAVMASNLICMLADSQGVSAPQMWEHLCRVGRERGLPGMT